MRMIGFNFFFSAHPLYQGHPLKRSGSSELFSLPTLLHREMASEHDPFIIDVIQPYRDYPIQVFAGQHYQCLVEGQIFDVGQEGIRMGITDCIKNGQLDTRKFHQWTSKLSGDFLMMVRTASQIVIANDLLGRLPLYKLEHDGVLFIGRSLTWLQQLRKLELNKIAVLEYLWCSYPLQHKTLFKHVQKCTGGSLYVFELQTYHLTTIGGSPLNFDERNGDSLDQCTERLDGLLKDATRQIIRAAGTLPINVSLSGGQDSRLAAYYLHRAKANLVSSSFDFPGAERDVAIASQLAKYLKMPWKKYVVAGSEAHEEELLNLKLGHNYLGLDFLVDYFKQLQKDQPSGSVLVTGDGGDKIIPYLGESSSGITFDRMVQGVMNRHSVIPIPYLLPLFNWSRTAFKDHLAEILDGYPERKANNKSIHFVIAEKVQQSFFEGEDRNRHYFWSVTPFYAKEVFLYAMQIQDHHKYYYQLYKSLLRRFDDRMFKIPDASGTSIYHPFFTGQKVFHERFRSVSPETKSFVKCLSWRKPKPDPGDQEKKDWCLRALDKSSGWNEIIDPDECKSLLKRSTHEQFMYIYTLLRLMQKI